MRNKFTLAGEKILNGAKKIRDSGLIDALDVFYLKPAIILFGSVSKGMDIKESDIDLVVVSESRKDFLGKESFGKALGKELHIFSVKSLKDLKNDHLIESVLNGIVLQGEIRWI